MTIVSVCLLLIAASTRSQTREHPVQVPAYEDRDGYEVLSVLLASLSVVRKNDMIKIDPRTSSGRGVEEIKAHCSGIPEEFQGASGDFDKRAKTKLTLRKEFTFAKPYELAYATVKHHEDDSESKQEARDRIRSGTYYVAAVGFNENRTRAIAFVEYICGNLCGDSIFYFLRKSEKGWEEAPEIRRQVKTCGRIY